MSNERQENRVQIYAEIEAIQRFRAFAEELGMTKTSAGTRLFDWFMRQPDVVQREILGLTAPSTRVQIARMVLEQMAGTSTHERLTGAVKRLPSQARKRGGPGRSQKDDQQPETDAG